MKLENFVNDQKEMMLNLQEKFDEQRAIIKTAKDTQKKAFDLMFESLKERVKDWDGTEVSEYLRITNDDDISKIEQEMVLTAFASTHHGEERANVIQALKAEIANDVVDTLTDILFGR